MNRHARRYALKTLVGPWMVLAVVPLEVGNFLMRGMPWRGEVLWTTDWFGLTLFITGPLLCGAAAVDAARLSRTGRLHMVVTTPTPLLPYVRAVLWCAVPAASAHVIAIVTALLFGGLYGNYSILWTGMAILVQCLAVFWYAAVGSAIGRFLSPVMAGAMATAGSFGANFLWAYPNSASGTFGLLDFGGATISRLGYGYNPWYLVTQLAVFSVTMGLTLLLVPTVRSGRRFPTVMGLAAAGVAVALTFASPQFPAGGRLTAHPVAPTECSGRNPVVCLYPEHRHLNGEVLSYIDRLVSGARSKGMASLVGARVEAVSRTHRPASDEISGVAADPAEYATGDVTVVSVATSLTTPLHCPDLYGEVGIPESYWVRQHSLTKTLLDAADIPIPELAFIPGSKVLTYPEAEKIRAEFSRCDLEGA